MAAESHRTASTSASWREFILENLIEIQYHVVSSTSAEGHGEAAQAAGLRGGLRDGFPSSLRERLTLEYVSYNLGDPKTPSSSASRRHHLFVPLTKLRLREEDFIRTRTLHGRIPMVTERGSFTSHGASESSSRSSTARPGIAFEVHPAPERQAAPSFRIIPTRTWLEVQFDNNRPALRLPRPPARRRNSSSRRCFPPSVLERHSPAESLLRDQCE